MASPLELTWPQVHAWRLARHHLIERAAADRMLDVVSDLCNVQAQLMSAAELALAARTEGIQPHDVADALWTQHTLVKTWMLRGTLHLISATDLPLYVAAHGSLQQFRRGVWLRYHNLTEAEMDALLGAVRDALDGRSLTREQLAAEVARLTGLPALAEKLRSGWGELLKPAAFAGALCFGPSQGQAVTFVRSDQWIGAWASYDPEDAWRTLLRRFLHTYGPAVKENFPRWFGILPGKRPSGIWKSLAAEMVEVDVEGWRAWVLAADADALQATKPASIVRLLPHFDTYTLGVAPHSSYLLPDAERERVYRKAAWISPVVVVDGRIEGVWKYDKRRKGTTVTVELFGARTGHIAVGIEAEAARLGGLLGAEVEVVYS